MTSADDEVRAAALVRLQQLVDRHGSRIPRDRLNEGVFVRGNRVPIWSYRKGIFKPAALGKDGAALSLHCSIDSPYDDEHDEVSGRIIYKYRGTDPGNADNVAVRRAFERALPLAYLVAVDPGVYDAIAPVYVEADDPIRHEFTLMADQIASVGQTPGGDPLFRREYATRAVLHRLHQAQFRRRVLAAYREQCGVCRLRHVELLDAAHILPDRHPYGSPVVSNGLGLCKIHHGAYDAHIIGIDPDARVHVRADILEEKDGPMLKHGIQGVSNSRLLLPRRQEDRPNRDYLAERFEQFRAA